MFVQSPLPVIESKNSSHSTQMHLLEFLRMRTETGFFGVEYLKGRSYGVATENPPFRRSFQCLLDSLLHKKAVL